MADWDADDFEPTGFDDKTNTDKWEGEDEDDDVKENWDDDEEEETKKDNDDEASQAPKATQVKKKRTLKEVLKEKEAQKIEEAKKKAEMKQKMEEESKPMTEEERMAEKLQQQKLVEESDLLLAMDTFGSSKEETTETKGLDSMNPTTKEEFSQYSKLLVEKLSKFESNVGYVQFLEDTIRDLCASLEADDLKKLSTTLNLLHSEKLKAQKGKTKGKTKPKKAGLTGGSKAGKKDDMDYADYGNEFDDFI